jgi:hypothetical protein
MIVSSPEDFRNVVAEFDTRPIVAQPGVIPLAVPARATSDRVKPLNGDRRGFSNH